MLCYSNVVMQPSQQLNKSKLLYRATSRQRLISGCFFLAVVAFFGIFLLAAHGKIDLARWLSPCGFKQRYNLPCPTCGMTTSIVAFAGGEIFESFYIQPAGALLCCVLVVSAILAFITASFGVYFWFLRRFFNEVKIRHIVLAFVIIIAAGWAVTLARALAQR